LTTRRVLVALIAVLAIAILVGGLAVAGLAYWQFVARGPTTADDLLVLDGAQRMHLVPPAGDSRLLAEDVSPELFRYPAFAPDGTRVAYISQDREGIALHSLDLRTGARTELYRSRENPPLYLAWSPDGRAIAFLSNRRTGGLGVHRVAADGSSPSELIGISPSSSYFAWQPDSGALLLHIGGSSFEQGRVSVYGPGSSEPRVELVDPGFFQAPAWSRDGSQFFYVAQPPVSGPLSPDRVESVLTRVAADGTAPLALASERTAAIIFLRSPASDRLAYTTISPAGPGALKLVDGAGGEVRTLSRPDEGVVAFFWSPDGARIAYLTTEPGGALPRFTWHVAELASGTISDLVSFAPSQAFAALVNFFDAYAISLDLWSPDGRQVVYGADDGVYVLDVVSGKAERRAAGVLGMWPRR